MPSAYTDSPSYAAVRATADQALREPKGLIVSFTVDRHGSLEQCAHLARSFQVSFASMRARERKLASSTLAEHKHATLSYAEGKYDKLVCQRGILPQGRGWTVGLYPTAMMLHELDIVSNDTGERITDIGVGQSPADRALETCMRFATSGQLIPGADWHALVELAPERAQDLRGDFALFIPANPHAPKADPLGEIDLEELAAFGGGEEEGG